jgi:hypothetical protein
MWKTLLPDGPVRQGVTHPTIMPSAACARWPLGERHFNSGVLHGDAYLNYLFEHLPAASTVEQIEALLPWNLKAMLDEQRKSPQAAQPSAA